jgi:hypothetical protein
MSFPQPAGYYGLQLSESAETLITGLDYKSTFNLLYDLVLCTSTENVDRFYAMSMTLIKWFEDEIDELSEANKIALIRWLGDRLAFLHTVPVQEVKS